MASSITWVDTDRDARQRSLKMLALFNERESRDELGLGAVRDSLGDQMFPGTSTIQTRLRYMLFVPWIYKQLEDRGTSASDMEAEARKRECELIAPLLADDTKGTEIFGVIGRLARAELKRLPSSIYWAGLGQWGIRRFDGSQEDYHQSVDELYKGRKAEVEKEADERKFESWHPKMPKPPDSFPRKIGFSLSEDDSTFLRDRIQASCKGTYLAWLTGESAKPAGDFPWEYPRLGHAPAAIRQLVEHARLFSAVMHGASLLYNLMLAEKRGLKARQEEYREALDVYAQDTPWRQLANWDSDEFWGVARASMHNVTSATEQFVKRWIQIAGSVEGRVADLDAAQSHVRKREINLKNPSRFESQAALKQWGGASGTAQLDYRWPTVKTFLTDLKGS